MIVEESVRIDQKESMRFELKSYHLLGKKKKKKLLAKVKFPSKGAIKPRTYFVPHTISI